VTTEGEGGTGRRRREEGHAQRYHFPWDMPTPLLWSLAYCKRSAICRPGQRSGVQLILLLEGAHRLFDGIIISARHAVGRQQLQTHQLLRVVCGRQHFRALAARRHRRRRGRCRRCRCRRLRRVLRRSGRLRRFRFVVRLRVDRRRRRRRRLRLRLRQLLLRLLRLRLRPRLRLLLR
jgi:hypothetical protein